jgi:hypothetical protein
MLKLVKETVIVFSGESDFDYLDLNFTIRNVMLRLQYEVAIGVLYKLRFSL